MRVVLKRTIAAVSAVAVAVLLITACTEGSSSSAPTIVGTQEDTTPYPTPTGLPTNTSYPTPTARPTQTPYPVAPTYTPQPTFTPVPTGTPYPTPTAQPTQTPYSVAPTYTPQPTFTPVPTPTPYPTPTLQPTPTPTPPPLLSRLYDTQNTRWLTRNYPGIARQIEAFPWVQDGLSILEAKAIDELMYLGVGRIDNLQAVLRLLWVQDAIADTEYDVLYWLRVLDYGDVEAAAAVIPMPFLESPDATDALAIRAMRRLATHGVLSALIDSALFQTGIADTDTALVAAVGTLYGDAGAVRRVLTPGIASIESVAAGTELTPDLRISIVRTGSQSRPGTVETTREAVAFVERMMQMPLPTEHVIVVLDDSSITSGYAGTNYGFAFSYSPEYETRQDMYEWRQLQAGFVHEVAHYYWRGNAGWIDEGVANTVEYVYGIENGLSRGQLKTRRKTCDAHDLAMLAMWDPSPNDSAYRCNYYLGDHLFKELLETLGSMEFSGKLWELYRVALPAQETGDTPGIAEIRQVFAGLQTIVDKHWSGALNAPENRPFDEGVDRTSHDLVQWDQHPTYDGHSVAFSGTLLDGAVLAAETIEQARAGGYQPFTLSLADASEFAGFILPPFTDGTRSWALDAGDSVANTYSLGDDTFTITFPFPEALGNPSDYVVIIDGYQDSSRTPRIGSNIDHLGYARIRVE